jgi:hypothetical protein
LACRRLRDRGVNRNFCRGQIRKVI